MKKLLLLCCVLSVFCVSAKEKVNRINPWPVEELINTTPGYTMSEAKDGVKTVIYESIDYRGAKKKVFAYYSTPGILKGDASLDKNLPAVVCVHGGGGRAFAEWAKMWAERGYAAVAMDHFGCGPKRKVRLEGGYEQLTGVTYLHVVEDQKEDWFYNAVPDVLSAHSFILSLDEVDKTRTAITGISWGGILTTLISGLDPRYKAAVPVYGCGFLYETGSMEPQIKKDGELAVYRWTNMYDPALYVVDSKIPMLFVNGTNDKHFYLNQWEKTVKLAKNARRSVRHEFNHGHKNGWAVEEIYAFVDATLGVKERLAPPSFKSFKMKKNTLSGSLKDATEGYKAYLVYSKAAKISHVAKWEKTAIEIQGDKFSVEIPEDYNQWYVSVEYPDATHYSSELNFRNGYGL